MGLLDFFRIKARLRESRHRIPELLVAASRKDAAERLQALKLDPRTLADDDRARFYVGLRAWSVAAGVGSPARVPLLEELEGKSRNYEEAAAAFEALLTLRRARPLPHADDERLMAALEAWITGLRKLHDRSGLPSLMDSFRHCRYAYLEAVAGGVGTGGPSAEGRRRRRRDRRPLTAEPPTRIDASRYRALRGRQGGTPWD